MHPNLFLIAVGAAMVFGICTVASSKAVEWVVDHVILPRFERGAVAVGDRKSTRLNSSHT